MDRDQLIAAAGDNELMRFLGVEIEEVSDGRVVLKMEVTTKIHQYIGIMHGGISLYLCETAASLGAVASSDLTKTAPVGVEINANHLRAVSKGMLTVVATAAFAGRTMSVWNIEITNDRDKLVCVSRCTMLHQKRPAFPSPQP